MQLAGAEGRLHQDHRQGRAFLFASPGGSPLPRVGDGALGGKAEQRTASCLPSNSPSTRSATPCFRSRTHLHLRLVDCRRDGWGDGYEFRGRSQRGVGTTAVGCLRRWPRQRIGAAPDAVERRPGVRARRTGLTRERGKSEQPAGRERGPP